VLRAVFRYAPLPLLLLDPEGRVRRANHAAGQVLGVGDGYLTGRALPSLAGPQSREAVAAQLAAVARTGKPRAARCALLGSGREVPAELLIRRISVPGEPAQLMVSVLAGTAQRQGGAARPAAQAANQPAASSAGHSAPGCGGPEESVVQAISRLDLASAAARLLLENATFSEAVTLQRCARLLADELAAWVIVDVDRQGMLRRFTVMGPEDPESAGIAGDVLAADPGPGTAPAQVHDSGSSMLQAHAEIGVLGESTDGVPLAHLLGASSVLCVPLSDGERAYGALTLIRQEGQDGFGIADVGLVEELGDQLALAIRMHRSYQRQAGVAELLDSSLRPRRLRIIEGAELAAAHIGGADGPSLSGDFYQSFPAAHGWGISVGDTCGKGEGAAAVTMVARTSIRALGHSAADPVTVLRGVNDILLAEDLGGRFVTACTGLLSWAGGSLRVRLGSAGHYPPVLVAPDGSSRQLPGGGLPLGVFPDAEPAAYEVELAPGDVLVLASDGLPDARSPVHGYYGDRLAADLAAYSGRQPADIIAAMRSRLLDFCGGEPRASLSMLALRAVAAPGE
jgi:PAS domain S-box-containing protein